MKLLIATDNFLPRLDGISMFLSMVIPRLKEQFEITVIAPDYPGDHKKIDGIEVVRLPLSGLRVGDFKPAFPGKKLFREIRRRVREADIVWTNTIGPIGTFTLRTADRYRKPQAAFVHSIEWSLVSMSMTKNNIFKLPAKTIAKLIARNLYNKCDVVMVPSLEVLEILSINGIRSKKAVIRLGIDTARFNNASDKRAAKESIGLNPDRKVVGYVGRIAREKDIVTLLRAYLMLKNKIGQTTLLLVGEGVSDYDRLIKQHPDILAVGRKEDVVPYLQAMDAYVLPSLLETTSLSTLEAMSCGIPVVCTPVGLVRNYIREKENGMLFRKGNAAVLSLKLHWLLTQPSIMRKMGDEARSTVLALPSWDKTAARIASALQSIASSAAKRATRTIKA